jgi:hypothetical protein
MCFYLHTELKVTTFGSSREWEGNVINSLASVVLCKHLPPYQQISASLILHPSLCFSIYIMFSEMTLLVSGPTPNLDNLELPFLWPVAFDLSSMTDPTRSLRTLQRKSPGIRASKPFRYLSVVAQWSVILAGIIEKYNVSTKSTRGFEKLWRANKLS